MLLKLKATIEKEIDVDEVLNSFMDYEPDVFLWYTNYKDVIQNGYDADACIALEQNAETVLKACIGLYIEKVKQYMEGGDLEEEMKYNPI